MNKIICGKNTPGIQTAPYNFTLSKLGGNIFLNRNTIG